MHVFTLSISCKWLPSAQDLHVHISILARLLSQDETYIMAGDNIPTKQPFLALTESSDSFTLTFQPFKIDINF